jgi:hypothetical protein
MPYRLNARDDKGKQVAKSFISDNYSKYQIKVIEDMFRKYARSGQDINLFKVPQYYEIPDNEVQKVKIVDDTPPPIKELFERMHINKLQLPENGNMSFACIGSTRSGKSYATTYIYEKIFKKYITFLMTLTTHGEIYKPFRKTAVIAEGFNSILIDEPMTINRATKNKYKFCVIMDDLVLNGKNDESMTKLLTVGRNFGMSAILCGQKMTMLSSTGRSNINYVLCFKQNTENAIEDTIKTFLRSYFPPDMKLLEMIRLYKQYTEDHNFFLVDTLNDKCYLSKI